MTNKQREPKRDVEEAFPWRKRVSKLRRLTGCIGQGKRFRIQVAGARICIPATVVISVEHKRGSGQEETEISLKWPVRRKLTGK